MSNTEVVQKIDQEIISVIGEKNLQGFDKAFKVSNAIGNLKGLLDNNYMTPIMELQGNRLGFKTDKDNSGGYPIATVKNCLIEAVLTGVQPVGNQFNIIAGNCYITKEGFGYLLKNYEGLKYSLVSVISKISETSALVNNTIEWTLGSESFEKVVPIHIKVNKYMGADAVIGKATRKARAWLYNNLSNVEIGDGDASDVSVEDHTFTEVREKPTFSKAEQRVITLMQDDIDSEIDTIDFEEKYKGVVGNLNNESITEIFNNHLVGK